MTNYDFRGLSDFDFENLAHDLLEKVLNVPLEQFTTGRDQGIDLRYSRRRGGRSLIVQCKHYRGSGFAKLLGHLKRVELPKVRALDPARYVVVTSLGLTPPNKAQIVKALSPYVKSTSDVLGAEDLNAALRKWPSIERAHFKLFLTSSVQLAQLASLGTVTRTRFQFEEFEARARLYVPGAGFPRAMKILKKHGACIVAGPPGTGKTTLASMIALYHCKRGYQSVVISSDVDEGDRLFDRDPDAKQIFLYDDFLGQTSAAEKLQKNEDMRLLSFMHRVSNTRNKLFVLTTREYILQEAQMRYERIERDRQVQTSKYILDIESYSRLDRAELLFNHVFFCDIPSSWKSALVRSKKHRVVIDHQNFNPRLVESAIGLAKADAGGAQAFVTAIERAFDSPKDLWLHPFERHLSPIAKSLLLVTATMPRDPSFRDAQRAFAPWGDARAVRDGLRMLNGSFLLIDGRPEGTMRQSNPSIQDFLMEYLNDNVDLLDAIVRRAAFFEQIEYLGRLLDSELDKIRYPTLNAWLADHTSLLLQMGQALVNAAPRDSAAYGSTEIDYLERCDCLLALCQATNATPAWLAELVCRQLTWADGAFVEVATAVDVIAVSELLGLIDSVAAEAARGRLLDNVLSRCESIDDFGPLTEFKECLPLVAETHRERIRDVLDAVVDAEIDYLSHQSEWADEAESRYEELASFCSRNGLTLSDYSREKIDERISRLNPRPAKRDVPENWRKSQKADESLRMEDAKIDSMFALL